jgi:hypothetical protein
MQKVIFVLELEDGDNCEGCPMLHPMCIPGKILSHSTSSKRVGRCFLGFRIEGNYHLDSRERLSVTRPAECKGKHNLKVAK